MKKVLAILLALTVAGMIAGCGNALSLDVDDNGDIAITAEKSASGEASTDLSIDLDSQLSVFSTLGSGTIHIAITDANGTAVFDADMTPESVFPVQTAIAAGEYKLTATAENANGQVLVSVVATGWGTGIANPWSDATSAAEAAQGAGLDSFTVPESIDLAGQTFGNASYLDMAGMAEARLNGPSAQITIRKGKQSEEPDISGDYNEYAAEWTQTAAGRQVTCYGAQEGAAAKMIWEDGFCSFSAVYQPLEDDGSGLSADDVTALVSAVS